VEAICIGLALLIVVSTIISIINFEFKAIFACTSSGGGGNDLQGIVKILPHMSNPNSYSNSSKLRANIICREPTTEHFRVYRLLHEVRRGEDQGITVSRESQVENLSRAPLHVGNAVIGPDLSTVLFLRRGISQNLLLLLIFMYHLTIFPILISVTIATVRVYKNLNVDTLKALNEFVDAVIVLALVEVGIGLKTFIWAISHTDRVHSADVGPDDY